LHISGLTAAVSGIYLSIPSVFNSVVDRLEPVKAGSRSLRFGDQVLFWLAQLHFGRFAGLGTKMIWTAIGLTPAVLFVTGSVMWWKRVVSPWRIKRQVKASRLKAACNGDTCPHSSKNEACEPADFLCALCVLCINAFEFHAGKKKI
jgi:cytochrome b subunit of formate dehydrogenase